MKSSKNLIEIISRRCFRDFIEAMQGHTDVKEWSEVGGLLRLVKKIIPHFDPGMFIDVGCGKRPTLATLLALTYGNEERVVCAIDPSLDVKYSSNINHLFRFGATLDEFTSKVEGIKSSVLAISNHGHCKRKEIESLIRNYEKWVYVCVPCCVDNRLNRKSIHFKDVHSFSPRNDIYIYADDETFKEISKIKVGE